MLEVFEYRPALARALWWSTLTDEAILRKWIVNIGQRDAYERVAHLIAEMWLRLNMAGLASRGGYDCPVTQSDLADSLGLTPVHTNRVLQRLRKEGLIELASKRLHIPDVRRLMDMTRFEPNYLHMDGRKTLLSQAKANGEAAFYA